jgi:hypothetical protein
MEAWLLRALELAGRLARHEKKLFELEDRALKDASPLASPARETGPAAPARMWKFADADDQWEHDVLQALVTGLRDLTREEAGLIARVEGWLESARSVREQSIERLREARDQAIASISDRDASPLYRGSTSSQRSDSSRSARTPSRASSGSPTSRPARSRAAESKAGSRSTRAPASPSCSFHRGFS